MKPLRSRKNQTIYDKYQASLPADAPCIFCTLAEGDEQFISESVHFKVLRNRFPYENWDYHKVDEHLMIVPKKHTDTLKELSFVESKEYLELITNFEFEGYNIYARTPGSKSKSIIHQHTHLIKFIPGSASGLAKKRAKSFAKSLIRR